MNQNPSWAGGGPNCYIAFSNTKQYFTKTTNLSFYFLGDKYLGRTPKPSIIKALPVHRSNILWKSRDMNCVCNRSIKFFCICMSLQAPRGSVQLMHFNCRIKTSSNEKWRVWIIQTTPYAPSSAHNRVSKREWSRLLPERQCFWNHYQQFFFCKIYSCYFYNHFIYRFKLNKNEFKSLTEKEPQGTYVCSLIIWRCLPSSPHTRHVQSSPAVTIN